MISDLRRMKDFGHTRHLRTFQQRRGATELLGVGVVLVLLAGIGGGVWWYLRDSTDSNRAASLLHQVARNEFVLTVTERGDIESSEDIEVRCEVKSKNTTGTAIIRLVKEGTSVQPGDFLVQLDSSTLDAEKTTQQIAVNTAKALMVEAQNTFETAQIALQEYKQGTFVQEQKTIENEIFVAKENLSRAKEYLTYSERLAAKGHITEQQLEADRFAVEKAAKELEVAETKLKVLVDFTRLKEVKTLESAIVTAEARWDSEQKSYELELSKLQEIEDQIDKCTITAPTAGTVVYAHEREGRDNDNIIQEGTLVRERQLIIRLPNPAKMQVLLKVNESLVKYVAPGMKAAVRPIGFEQPLSGTVTQVNQFAEPNSWRNPNVREYKAFVRIEESHPELRSGMTALVTIECAYLPDVLKVPVQAVYSHGRDYYCFVRKEDGWEPRPLKRGPTNHQIIVIEDGVQEGELIALSPRTIRDQVALPRLAAEDSQNVVQRVTLPDDERPDRRFAEAQSGDLESSDANGSESDGRRPVGPQLGGGQ